jgi:hypothetical protein
MAHHHDYGGGDEKRKFSLEKLLGLALRIEL